MAKNRRFLGDLDALVDQDFKTHFVESTDLKRILRNESDIVYGSKGVGKTALCRALTELNEPYFYATKTIYFDRLSFAVVHDALSTLKDTTKDEVPKLAADTWRNVLAKYSLEAVGETLEASDPLKHRIDDLLDREGFRGEDSNNPLTSQIERFLNMIADLGVEKHAPTPLGLNQKQRNVVNTFPSNPEVESLLRECSKVVEQSKKFVLICLDGFDSIVGHTSESRRAIFAGLIDAIHKSPIVKGGLLGKAFCFKAFLPQELTNEARSVVWDIDKYILHTHYLRWAESDFQSFLMKRLIPYSRKTSSKFKDIWLECMPDRVTNASHRTEELSFNYLLRHTLYRPRQLLTHLQVILDKWDETRDSFRVDPSFIPPVVAGTNYLLAKAVVGQLETKRPGLSRFLQSWKGTPITVSASDFQDRLSRILGIETPEEVNIACDDLYNFGVFGIASKETAIKGSQQTHFRFGFVEDGFERNANTSIEEGDLLALSPMFREYCGCTPSEYGIVVPVDN